MVVVVVVVVVVGARRAREKWNLFKCQVKKHVAYVSERKKRET